MINKIFFANPGTSGITSTSACAIANYAQEIKSAYMAQLENVSFVDEYRDLVGTNSGEKKVRAGISDAELKEFMNLAYKCAKLDSLCAWLREAVKNKEAWLEEVKGHDVTFMFEIEERPTRPVALNRNEYCRKFDIEVPKMPEAKKFTQENILLSMNVKEYCNYLSSNSSAAVFGKIVHLNGALNEARKEVNEKIAAPYDVDDNMITHYIPTVSQDIVEKVFADFQATQRNYNAQYNSIKSKIIENLDAIQKEADNAYEKAWREYTSEIDSIDTQNHEYYQEEMRKYKEAYTAWDLNYAKCVTEFQDWQRQELERISKLKIIIPDSLEETFAQLDAALRKKAVGDLVNNL